MLILAHFTKHYRIHLPTLLERLLVLVPCHCYWNIRPHDWYDLSEFQYPRYLRLHSVDDDILMSVPELYRYGREGYWFGTWTFAIYMLEAVYQVISAFDRAVLQLTSAVCDHILHHCVRILLAIRSYGWI